MESQLRHDQSKCTEMLQTDFKTVENAQYSSQIFSSTVVQTHLILPEVVGALGHFEF